MVRQKIKGTKVRRSLTPEEEPNFYLPDWEKRLKNAEKSFMAVTSPQNSKLDRQAKRRPNMSKSTPQHKASQKKIIRSNSKSSVKGKPDSLVAMMREAQHQVVQSVLLPPPVIRTTSRPQSENVQGGDLLFFEGLPFRYLDHMEEVPAAFSHQPSQPAQTLSSTPRRTPPRPYTFPDKDDLLRTISSIVTGTTA